MKTRYIIAPIVIALAILVAFSTPAMANYAFDGFAVTTRTSGSINGTVYVDSVGWNGQTTRTLSTNVPSGTVKAAYLYTGVWCGNPTNTGWVNVTFNGNYTANGLGPINIRGENDNNPNVWCSGYGKSWWYYNVTNLTNAGQTNTATTSKINGSIDGRVYGIVLVVVLEDSSLHPIQYWVNDGSYCLNYETPQNTHTTNFAGSVDTGNVTYAELAAVYLTGYSPQCKACTKFNDHLLNTSEITTNTFYLKTYGAGSNVTAENVTSSGNDAEFLRGSDSFVNICNAILTLNDTANDLIVTGIDVGTPRPNNDSTVKATVKNCGSDSVGHFNVSLYVDNVLNGTVNVTAGLGAGASTTVSFTKVNESKGCYDFKVFVDSHGNVSEDIETNNNLTVKGQVGYVIEVNSYSDFDDLVTESNNNLLGAGNVSHSGDTYYIKNFTGSSAIENCAGDGISIQNLNTSTKFEINNCTIKDCTHSGVYLRNLSNGTVNGSEMLNNSYYGINVYGLGDISNTKLISITNNTINGSKIDGIDLIGLNCTVKNNDKISNSTVYGIYLFGNYTDITDNTIRDNTDYGIKAYNSYNNNIYYNNFISNGATGHQAWDNKNTDINNWDDGSDEGGNYWNDWDENSGREDGWYIIDGDAGQKDEHPKDSQF
jgi:parallel beta-helix repeat protein